MRGGGARSAPQLTARVDGRFLSFTRRQGLFCGVAREDLCPNNSRDVTVTGSLFLGRGALVPVVAAVLWLDAAVDLNVVVAGFLARLIRLYSLYLASVYANNMVRQHLSTQVTYLSLV